MKKAGLVVTILSLMGALFVPWSGALATTDGIHQLSQVTYTWDGTDASTTNAPTADYDYTYGDDANVTYQLPWSFSYYGQSYDQINVDTNGNIWFAAAGAAYSFNLANSGRGPVIAAWNNDLSSNYYGGVFIQHKSNPERIVIEWQTEAFTEQGYSLPNNFEVVLYRNGAIRFDYNTFTTANGLDAGSGISKGNGTYYDITSNYGNITTLGGHSYSFTDPTAPRNTIRINNGAPSAATAAVTLAAWCTDTITCTQMQFSNDNQTWSTPEQFAATKAWTLSGGDGTKTVYTKVQDSTGTWYATTDTIQLDSTAPNTSASPSGGTYICVTTAPIPA